MAGGRVGPPAWGLCAGWAWAWTDLRASPCAWPALQPTTDLWWGPPFLLPALPCRYWGRWGRMCLAASTWSQVSSPQAPCSHLLPACLPACSRSRSCLLLLSRNHAAVCPSAVHFKHSTAPACLPCPPADGSFPNHTPNPEDKKAVEATRAAVLATGADLGIMLDTDVDRSGVVDREGNGARLCWGEGGCMCRVLTHPRRCCRCGC
jgi:hypothetical protein